MGRQQRARVAREATGTRADFPANLESPALQQVDAIGAVPQEVQGELDIDRMLVGRFQHFAASVADPAPPAFPSAAGRT